MDEGDRGTDSFPRLWQGLAPVAREQKADPRGANGMGGDLPLAHVDFPVRQALAQMIIGAPVAEAELQDGTGKIANEIRRMIKAGPLCLQATDKAVEAAHGRALLRDAGARLAKVGRRLLQSV